MDKENEEREASSKNREVIEKYKKTKKLVLPADSNDNDGDPDLEGEGDIDELQDILGSGFDALIQASIVATPAKQNNRPVDKPAKDNTHEQVFSEVDLGEEVNIDCILDHRKKDGTMEVQVKYTDGSKEWSNIGFVWYDDPDVIKKYQKKNGLRGAYWFKSKSMGNMMLGVMGERHEGASRELNVLWDNGYLGWSSFDLVYQDEKELVDLFLEKKNE